MTRIAVPWRRMAHLYSAVAAAVEETIRAGERPVVLSGDCTTSFAVIPSRWKG
jgi:arginase